MIIILNVHLYWLQVNIGIGDDLVPSGNKPSPEPMFDRPSDKGLIHTH